jgi:hypothetical protein
MIERSRIEKGFGALVGIALGVSLSRAGAAQAGQGGASTEAMDGTCPNREPHECADRCPNVDTCFIQEEGQLYYLADDRRFDCDGYDCTAANQTLLDYCCERGEFAPERSNDGGGCSLAPPRSIEGWPSGQAAAGSLAFALGLLAARRRGEPE